MAVKNGHYVKRNISFYKTIPNWVSVQLDYDGDDDNDGLLEAIPGGRPENVDKNLDRNLRKATYRQRNRRNTEGF